MVKFRFLFSESYFADTSEFSFNFELREWFLGESLMDPCLNHLWTFFLLSMHLFMSWNERVRVWIDCLFSLLNFGSFDMFSISAHLWYLKILPKKKLKLDLVFCLKIVQKTKSSFNFAEKKIETWLGFLDNFETSSMVEVVISYFFGDFYLLKFKTYSWFLWS